MRYVKFWLFPRYFRNQDIYLIPLWLAVSLAGFIHALFGRSLLLLVILLLILFVICQTISGFSNIRNKKTTAGVGLFIMTAGDLMNFMVIALNNWHMPVVASLEELRRLNSQSIYIHFEQSNYKLLWFSDWIGGRMIGRFSPGDLVIISGFVVIMVAIARRKK